MVVSPPLAERAPAKVNLTLRVLGRREDGYHTVQSLVAFALVCDRLVLLPGDDVALSVVGPMASVCGPTYDNLVLKATRALGERVEGLERGHFVLTKELPVAAGLGGGSADAAAALRLLARLNGLALDDERLTDAALATGADVPVCLDPRARMMRGIGEILSEPLALPPLAAVLVNSGAALATKDVFAALRAAVPSGLANDSVAVEWPDVPRPSASSAPHGQGQGADARGHDALIASLVQQGNDLEGPAIGLQPVVAEVLKVLRALPKVRLARMSGSGTTCFALFDDVGAAQGAARILLAERPQWWVRATLLG